MSDKTDTYAVGWLAAIQQSWRALTVRGLKGNRRAFLRSALRREWRYTVRQAKAGNWRAVQNTLNGYLCEHDGHPHNCGTGWTKRTARRRAERLCAKEPA